MNRHTPAIRQTVAAVAAGVLAAGCADKPTAPRESAQQLAPLYRVEAPGRATDRYIVVLSDTVTNVSETVGRIMLAHGGSVRHVYEHVLRGFSVILPAQAVEGLRAHPAVSYIRQVEAAKFRVGDHTSQSNAPWGLDRIDQRNLPLNTWYAYSEAGSGVRIYVVDTGIRTAHNQFGGRASVGFDARPVDGLNGQDCQGHGTHVAGIAGGQTYGVAKSASLIAVKVNVGCTNGIDPDDLIAGINWVGGNHTKPAVTNVSIWGPTDADVDQAINDAVGLGVMFVVIAGNDGSSACNFSPARAAQAFTIGATASTDARSAFSNIGTCVDMFAPGQGILSAWATSNTATQTASGTSQAAPFVAGVIARYLQRVPSAAPSTARSAILARATQGLISNPGTGSPNLLLHSHFLDAAISGPSTIPSCATYTWYASASGIGSVFTYVWERGVYTGFGVFWQQVGTGPDYSRNVCPGHESFYLRVTVTDNLGFHRRPVHWVNF